MSPYEISSQQNLLLKPTLNNFNINLPFSSIITSHLRLDLLEDVFPQGLQLNYVFHIASICMGAR
jgi:hypothetical protein